MEKVLCCVVVVAFALLLLCAAAVYIIAVEYFFPPACLFYAVELIQFFHKIFQLNQLEMESSYVFYGRALPSGRTDFASQ